MHAPDLRRQASGRHQGESHSHAPPQTPLPPLRTPLHEGISTVLPREQIRARCLGIGPSTSAVRPQTSGGNLNTTPSPIQGPKSEVESPPPQNFPGRV